MFGFGSSKLKAGRKYRVRISVGNSTVFGGLKVWDYDAVYVPDDGETEDDAKEQMGPAAMARWQRENGRTGDLCIVGFSMTEM